MKKNVDQAKTADFVRSTDSAPMVVVPAGEFLMGADTKDTSEDPPHSVSLGEFLIDKYHVTNTQYHRFVKATKYVPEGQWKAYYSRRCEYWPVVAVTWADAKAYASWIGGDLPTEAQWEKAARGTDGRRYPWGDRWNNQKCACWEGGVRSTAPVGAFPGDVSPYGCFDMAGNIGGWMTNWATIQNYSVYPQGDPGREDIKDARSGRGGNWFSQDRYDFKCSTRGMMNPKAVHERAGFRCVLTKGEG